MRLLEKVVLWFVLISCCRIKTNGSLPRDKRLLSPGATAGASEDEMGEIFTFETSSTSVTG
jgi:hypothetical protein